MASDTEYLHDVNRETGRTHAGYYKGLIAENVPPGVAARAFVAWVANQDDDGLDDVDDAYDD